MIEVNYKPTILYVEDEEGVRINLAKFLTRVSRELHVAENGREGLELWKQYRPDIVISDISMPLMNGLEMAQTIKELNANQNIIFTSAYSDSNYFIDAIEMSVDGYILKPVSLEKLKESIRNTTNRIILFREYQKQLQITQEIATLQDNLIFMLNNSHKIIFINSYALEFFQVKNREEFTSKYKDIYHCFINNEQSIEPLNIYSADWLDKVENLSDDQRVVVMMDESSFEPKAFVISAKSILESGHIIITFTEITKLALKKDEFRKRAFFDELTNIYNRAYFNQEAEREILKFKRSQIPFCLIMFDIDFFKKFNDTYGHDVGDYVLKDIASIVTKTSRPTDTVARWGGEEFVVILPQTSLNNAAIVAENFRKEIEHNKFMSDIQVTCSFGISELHHDDTIDTLLKRADIALYKAKNSGRNRVELEE